MAKQKKPDAAESNTGNDFHILWTVNKDNLRILNRNFGILYKLVDNPVAWPLERVGTVDTVQGIEAEAVLFVLGAPLLMQNGARIWAGLKPNLLNVAVTRDIEVIFVVGDRGLWKNACLIHEFHSKLLRYFPDI